MDMNRAAGALLTALVLSILMLAGCDDHRVATEEANEPTEPKTIVVRNNYEDPYEGPIEFSTAVPSGTYEGEGARGVVEGGIARVTVSVPAASDVVLKRTDGQVEFAASDEDFSFSTTPHGVEIRTSGGDVLGRLAFDLVVRSGTAAGPADAVASFDPIEIEWEEDERGHRLARVADGDFDIALELKPNGGGWLDVEAVVTRQDPAVGDAYVALVRRIATPSAEEMQMRWNGRVVDGPNSPEYWERDFWYTRGVDWTRWAAGPHAFVAANAFATSPIILDDDCDRRVIANHFYVWERAREADDGIYLISEIAGPNPEQVKSRYMPVRPYTPPTPSDTLRLAWRLAVTDQPSKQWEDSQLRGFAGYRAATDLRTATVVNLGVPHVAFGTSYFPYSTFLENFDFYRVPGVDKETWWAFSREMWQEWREFVPQMQADLRIIKAMGFDWVRLHYLAQLTTMPREDALDFLDFYMNEARTLGLQVLADSEGPAEWLADIAGRYGDVLKRVELENEILIQGIKPGDPERWTALYEAVKSASPETEVFLTGAGANGMFEVLQDLEVPFDRVGLHAYKHGPEGKDAFSSHALGTGGYATSIGKPATLGEFNWKSMTRLSPEARREEFRATYEEMLEPRAIPEFFQFHFQETMSVNPSISRSGIRHYETIHLDRRPKPEAEELMRLIARYARPDAPVRTLQIRVPEVAFSGDRAEAAFRITNITDREIDIRLRAEAHGALTVGVESESEVTLAPKETIDGVVALRLGPGAETGTYHHFLVAEYDDVEAYGWGVAANVGKPTFEGEPVIGDDVEYPDGHDVVAEIDWTRPIAVAFGADAPWLEMEMAYITANTLQSATGRRVRLSSAADTPSSYLTDGTLILIGTAETNSLIAPSEAPTEDGTGIIRLQRGESEHPQALLLTGTDRKAVQAAATDFVLRYWQNAKDAAIRTVGMEPGAALGSNVRVTNPDPP